MLVDILVLDGLDEMDAWGPAEVFRSAGRRRPDIRTRLVTRLAQDTELGVYGLRFLPDGVFEPGAADVLVVAGGGWAARDVAGAWGEVQRGDLLPLLVQARRSTPLVAWASSPSRSSTWAVQHRSSSDYRQPSGPCCSVCRAWRWGGTPLACVRPASDRGPPHPGSAVRPPVLMRGGPAGTWP